MKDILILTLKLFLICAIAAALLGGTYYVTKKPIEEGNMQRAIASRKEVLKDAQSFEQLDLENCSAKTHDDVTGVTIDEAYYAVDESGEKIGMTIKVITKGYNPGIEMTVGLGTDGVVEAISIGSHEETPGLGANACEPKFKDQFKGVSPYIDLGKDIDAITSATKTSTGVVNGVNAAYDFFEAVYE